MSPTARHHVPKSDADSIFNSDGLLDAPNDQVHGPISRTLCSGFNRGTLLDGVAEPDTGSATSYQEAGGNQ